MDSILIVGAGFTAALVDAYCDATNVDVISPKSLAFPQASGLKNNVNLNINKPLGVRADSLTAFQVNCTPNIKLHHRTVIGGNSTIWGGFYNSDLEFDPKKSLNSIGANLIPLSYQNTGCISNDLSICQLQDLNGNVFSASRFFASRKIDNYFCKKIVSIDKKVAVELISLDNGKCCIKEYDRVFFCSGVFDAMCIINESFGMTFFEMSDFSHMLKVNFSNNFVANFSNETVIRYSLPRAVNHYLGVQKTSFLKRNYIPLYIDQIFSKDHVDLKIEISNKVAHFSTNHEKFGDSIHYNNLKVNGIPLNEFSSSISEKIFFFGMASVAQKKPGPISSDIHQYVHNYFRDF